MRRRTAQLDRGAASARRNPWHRAPTPGRRADAVRIRGRGFGGGSRVVPADRPVPRVRGGGPPGLRRTVAAHRRRGLPAGTVPAGLPGRDRGHLGRRGVLDHPPSHAHPRSVRAARGDPRPGRHGRRPRGPLCRPTDRPASQPRPRAGGRHRHLHGGLRDHRPADREPDDRRRPREPAAVRRQRRDDPDLVREGLPRDDAPRPSAGAQPRAPRPLPRARHRPPRGLRGDDRREQHDARPLLRDRHRADRRMAVPVDHRAGDEGRQRLVDLGAPPRARGRAADEPVRPRRRRAVDRQSRGGRHGGGPGRRRSRGWHRDPDARRHRDQHRGGGDRRDALPGGVVPGGPGLRGRPRPLRDARRRRRDRVRPPRR